MKRFPGLFVLLPAIIANNTFARDWLQPLPSREREAFVLEDFRFVPYRFTYNGFATEKANIRYLFKSVDGRILALHPGEVFGGVALIDADVSRKTVTVRDDRLNQTLTLELGKETLLPNRFEGILRYRDKRFPFSEQPLRLDDQTQLTLFVYNGHLYFLEEAQGKEPSVPEVKMP